MNENQIGTTLLEAAIQIHRELGPGLLETVYEAVLARELSQRGFAVERQVPVPIIYKGIQFEEGFRADIIVNQKVLLYHLSSLTGLSCWFFWRVASLSSLRLPEGSPRSFALPSPDGLVPCGTASQATPCL